MHCYKLHEYFVHVTSLVQAIVAKIYNWSKFFDETPHRKGGGFFAEENLMWHRPVGSIAVGCHVESWMIPFAAYTAAETPNAFQCARWLPKIAPFRGGSRPHLIHCTLGRTESAPNEVIRLLQAFASAVFISILATVNKIKTDNARRTVSLQ